MSFDLKTDSFIPWKRYRDESATAYLKHVYEYMNYSPEATIEVLGINRSHLYQLLKRHGVEKPRSLVDEDLHLVKLDTPPPV